ncbi:lipopolysaccharide export system permease protein [Kosakonia radicincitans]|uniref:LPS export ABC transporter permease LptF n=1 Tax=Kosakonia radicincitans TaxID=283686 RepID=UPI0009A730DC|nr:LPS export ABC transporter permease LptF [Kosakonia radicincitans]SKC18961.1 lipopolysaccharide export system permease protein [Kosakonia radicincitans]
MYLIERYILNEIRRLTLVIVCFLIFMFACFSAQRYMTDAANGTLALEVVFRVVCYKVLIALEMLLPVGLYVAAAISLGQLYTDSEITAMLASGSSPARLYKAVVVVAIPLGIMVTLISLYGRPWAYSQIYQLEQQSQSALDISHLQANKFNTNSDGRMVLARQINAGTHHLGDALIYTSSANNTSVYRARSVDIISPSPANPTVMLRDGSSYFLDRNGQTDRKTLYRNLRVDLKPVIPDTAVRRKSASLAQLSHSSESADIAELQWRESRGVSTILMVLLAIPLSRTKPRQGRFATLLPLTILFATIFFGSNICRTLIANGSLPTIPGMWLVPLIMLIGLVALVVSEFSLLQKMIR